jgi:hypothetical protein
VVVAEFGFDEAADFLFGEAEGEEALDGVFDEGFGFFHATGEFSCVEFGGDEGAGALTEFDESFVFEFAVCLGDGIGIHDDGFSEAADGGELVAGAEGAGFDPIADLLHQLEVDGDAGVGIEAKDHGCLIVIVP